MPFPCQHCQAATINGVACHETGCPDAWRDYDRACRECGCAFRPSERCQALCDDCVAGLESVHPEAEAAPLSFPTIAQLRSALAHHQRWLRRTFKPSDEPCTDVRLRVTSDGWQLLTGDPQYDTDHRGAWGTGSVPLSRCNLTSVARDMIRDARDNA